MSVELADKGVSTEDLDTENVKEKEIQKQDSEEKEKKETTDLEKLEAVLSALVENKVKSIRSYGKKTKEKKLLFNKFKTGVEDESNLPNENQENKNPVNSSSILLSSCKCICHQYDQKSIVPCEPANFCQRKTFSRSPQPSIESSHQLNLLHPKQSLETCDGSILFRPPENVCCSHRADIDQRLDRKKLSAQKCLPKRLSTQQWLNSTSRQTSTETATTSSGYISPTFGTGRYRNHSIQGEFDVIQADVLTETSNDIDSETIIDMSKIQAQKTVYKVDELTPSVTKTSNVFAKDSKQLKVNNSDSKDSGDKCDACHVFLPQCLSTTCIPSCKYSMAEDRGCFNAAPSYRHLHPSGGHYVSCCNSPTHSFQFQYDENYLMLAMNLEDLEFEQEEERRKRRKRKKKRRKERQARARGLMADELKSVKQAAKQLDPEDLPKRARWTIVATACLLLLMCMLLVGVTLRMAPIIDEMARQNKYLRPRRDCPQDIKLSFSKRSSVLETSAVRKENEEMLNSLSRQGSSVKEAISLNTTKNSTPGTS